MRSSVLLGGFTVLVACLAALLATFAIITSSALSDSLIAADESRHTARVYQRTLDELKDAILDAETGQRGYLLTGDKAYLTHYKTAQERVAAYDFAATGAPDEGTETGTLEGYVKIKMSEMAQTIALFDSGSPRAALTVVNTDRGREVMSDIRVEIARRQDAADEDVVAAKNRADQLLARGQRLQRLLALTIGLMVLGAVSALYQAWSLRRAQMGKEEAEQMRERMEVLANELDHRMKNLFAVSAGMIRQSARGRGPEAAAFADEVGGRMRALSQAYSVTRQLDETRSMPKSEIIDKVVRAQLLETHQFDMDGEDRDIAEKGVTPFALILHEWTTNALKYGAWKPTLDADSGDDARGPFGVRLSWSHLPDGQYELLWDERHVRAETELPQSTGYGSRLVRLCAAQLKGDIVYDWHDEGVRIKLTAAPDYFQTASIS